MILIKNKEQIEGIRRSCRLAADTLRFIGNFVKEGVSTQKLNDIAVKYLEKKDAVHAPLGYLGFPKSICTSINEVICHGIPSDNEILKNGDIINVDVTTIFNGYYGDTSTMFHIGEASDEAFILMEVAYDCLHVGINQVKPGNRFGDIGVAITKYAEMNGFSVVHQFCGHGIGINFHEDPSISHDTKSEYDETEMEPGMIFTIEPMINSGVPEAVILEDKWTAKTVDGKLSAQYEHTILVTDTGYEILT